MEATSQSLEQFQSNFFDKKILYNSKKILESQTISFSFTKGDLDGFFTASGLVGNHAPYQTRITFKKSTNTLSSSCTCLQWTPEHHCEHAAAILTKFYLQKSSPETVNPDDRVLNPHLSFVGQGVVCENYGTLIETANRLKGALPSSAFYSLQYRLTGGKLLNLDTAKIFPHKLKIDLIKIPVQGIDPKEYFRAHFYRPKFALLTNEGVLIEEISLFDTLYLFNWNTGEVFDLPMQLKNWLRKLKNSYYSQTIDEYIRNTQEIVEHNQVEIHIEGQKLSDIPVSDLNGRVSITKSTKKNHMSLCLEFYTPDNEQLVMLSDYFRLFAFENGFLESFRIKMEGYEFLKSLLNPMLDDTQQYRRFLRYSSDRDKINEMLDFMQKTSDFLFYEEAQNRIIKVDRTFLMTLFASALAGFTDLFFKYSSYNLVERKMYFEIPRVNLFAGMTSFYTALQVIGVPIFYNKHEVKNWRSKIKFERKKSQVNWFELDIQVSDEDLHIINQAEINEDFALTNEGLVMLTEEQKDLVKLMKKYTQYEGQEIKIDPNDLSKKFSLRFNRARIFELFELRKLGIEGALTQEEIDFCNQLLNLQEMPEYELPEKVKDIARPYQVTGYRWLRFLFENNLGACLADDMGLGKTLQTIVFLSSIIHRVEKVLIVCPVSIILNWQNEIQKFSDLPVDVFYGDSRELKPDSKIILTSYGLMKKEAFEKLSEIEFDIMILDEVQNLKNIRSVGANAARQLKAKFRICLTGTPVENDLSEFYNIIDLSIPGIWGDIQFVKSNSSKKSRLLAKKLVRPFVLRRTKAQVLQDLPDKIENHVFLDMSDEEKAHYQGHLVTIKNRLAVTGTNKKYGEILKGLLELRQLCLWQKRPELQSTKIEFLMENLESILAEGHKAIVFSQFTTYLDIIQDKVISNGWNYARIDGSQTLKTRGEQVEKFQNGKASVFLISLKAGGVGLNLTAASYIFLMDPWWNPAVENQAIDRAHRIGQKNTLTVYRPIIKNSVEEKVLILQQAKKELFNDLMNVDDDKVFSGRLTMEDFQSLLS
ncbi:MAG: DEAD/DEAH box helicase [Bacteriovoracaceae bacterium]